MLSYRNEKIFFREKQSFCTSILPGLYHFGEIGFMAINNRGQIGIRDEQRP
jgi:hypothetical protein